MIATFRPTRPRPLVAVASGLLVIVAASAVSWLAHPTSSTRPTIPTEARVDALAADTPPPGATERLLERYAGAVRAWTTSLEASQANYIAATNLGLVLAGRARLTGDLSDYHRALEAADTALAALPGYLPAMELRAALLFSLHEFSAAREAAQSVVDRDPSALQALATMGDASLELGDVAGARLAYESVAARAPTPPAWSRLSRLSFIEGDIGRAITLVENARAGIAATAGSEEAAFYAFQHGDLLRAAGRNVDAEAAYLDALEILPDYVPATAGLARIREAQGRRAEAIDLLEAATARLPQPELVATLGDLYALAGDDAAAERQYALVERIGAVGAASGSVYDRQLVLFAADHGRGIEQAVALAEASLQERSDIYGYDALAWALYRAGRLDEAAEAATRAMTLGTPDPRLAYHAGMIALARGETEAARVLLDRALAGAAYLPPLQVPAAEAARETLRSLE
jgi:tetratricopeptide (TPR) repeat protein